MHGTKEEYESKKKTVRFSRALIEAIEELPPSVYERYGREREKKLDFSEAARWGLVLVLAAHGEEYAEPAWSDVRRSDAAANLAESETLEAAKEFLLAANAATEDILGVEKLKKYGISNPPDEDDRSS